MAIFKCLDCPRIKSGHPYKCSKEFPWLCDPCAHRRQEAVVIKINHEKPVLKLKALVKVRS